MIRFYSVLFLFFSICVSAQDGVYTTVEQAPVLTGAENQLSSATYDFSGVTLTKSRSFYNSIGREDQNQVWDIRSGKVWATQTLYDLHGRPALSTLGAPVGTSFGYQSSFILDGNNSAFTVSDFDIGGSIENPSAVGLNADLRAYYSNQNTSNVYQDITERPYSRVVYSDLNPGEQLHVLGGNKMDGEWKQSYTFTMTAGSELAASNAFGFTFDASDRILKSVNRDVHGVDVVSFTDVDGKILAAARSGLSGDLNQLQYVNTVVMGEQGYTDIHIPEGITSFNVYNNDPISNGSIRVYNLITETLLPNVINGATGTIAVVSGFYRVYMTDERTYRANNGTVEVSHQVNYYDYALSTYDRADRLISSKQPLNQLESESAFKYNTLGQLVTAKSPDEGGASFIYRTDGQVRFSRNSKQLALGEFSYTSYDQWGRPTDSGVYKGPFPDETEADTWEASCGPDAEEPPVDFIYQENIGYYSDTRISWKVPGDRFFAGISHSQASNWTNTIYGLYCKNGQLLPTLHGSCVSGSIGSYTANDVIAIERIGTDLVFKKNNSILYVIDTTGSVPLGIHGDVYIASTALINDYTVSAYVDVNQDLPDATNFESPCKEQTFTMYDSPDDDLINFLAASTCNLPADQYKQTFLAGNVSKTWTRRPKTNITWYSYDVLGRVKWLVQKNPGMSCPTTIDYEYNPINSEVMKIVYQKYNEDERFEHKYEYDVSGQLTKVLTSRDGETYSLQAQYYYNEDGSMRRTELAEDLQGIDYVYNLSGQLKSINSPEGSLKDPGGDGANGFATDVFGMDIAYYDGDYTRSNTPTPVAGAASAGTDQYNGNIKAIRWHQNDEEVTINAQSDTYAYSYDKNNWLKGATYGTSSIAQLNAGINKYNFTSNPQDDYQVKNLSYDANGNIKTLSRNGFTSFSGTNSMDNFEYQYANGGNQLTNVIDTGDNQDPERYDDLRDQSNFNNIPNYSYNAVGELVMNLQDGIQYEYYTSGLVKRINGFSPVDNGVYGTIYQENFNSSSGQIFANDFENGTAAIVQPVCPGVEPFDQELMVTVNNVAGFKKVSTVPGAFHKLRLDAFFNDFDQPIIYQDFTVSAIAPDGSVLDSRTFSDANDTVDNVDDGGANSDTRSSCDWSYHDVELEFVSPENYIRLSFTTSTLEYVTAPIVLDNLLLEAAVAPKLDFVYDDRGHRVRKDVHSEENIFSTHYIRDPQGRVLSIYSSSTIAAASEPRQLELPVYGANRLGMFKPDATDPSQGSYVYQLQDHLGNVRAVVTKINGNAVSLVAKTDYYPGGMAMPNRNIVGDYRYNYQGQELDQETGQVAFELRLYDPRINRWLTTDPYGEFHSPYLSMGNNWINKIDPDGGKTDDIIYLDTDGNETHRVASEGAHRYFQETYDGELQAGVNVGSFVEVNSPVNINFNAGLNQDVVSVQSLNTLQDIGLQSRVYDITITSTARNAEAQARAMYNNIVRNYQEQRNTYRAPGQRVIDEYDASVTAGLNRAQTIQAMTDRINALGPGTVSRHAADHNVLNVMDLSQRNIPRARHNGFFTNGNAIEGVRILNENRVFHIEIHQN